MTGIAVIDALSPYYPQLLAFVLTTVGSLAAYFIRPRVSLIWGVTTELRQPLPTNPEKTESVMVNSKNFVVRNTGRTPAENVQIVFNYEPDGISIWPQRDYSKSINPENRLIIKLDGISSRESISIDMICVNREVPFPLDVRDKSSVGKPARFVTIKQVPVWLSLLVLGFSLIGLFYGLSLLIQVLR